jgi:hypothetical protein
MKRVMIAAAVLTVAGTGVAFSDEGGRRFREFLNGFKEATTVVSTTGTGTFRAVISRDGTEINYELTFKDLEGDVLQAHIHIGHPQNQGGIVLWLCDSDAPGPQAPSPNTPLCTVDDPLSTRAGRVTGTLTAADVQNQPGNGIVGATATTPGEWEEVLALIRAGRTYVNVHSSKFPPGEIRSQLDNRDDGDHGGHDDH